MESAQDRSHRSRAAAVLKLIRNSEAELNAPLRGPRLLIRDLFEIEPGDLLRLDYRVEQLVDCDVNGKAKFRGRVVNSNRKKAFLIESMPELQ